MKKRYVIAGLASIAAVIAVFFLSSSPTGTGSVISARRQNGRVKASGTPLAPDRQLLPLALVLEEARQEAENPGEAWAADGEDEGVDGAVRRVQEINPLLGRFHTLRSKALRTSKERREYRDMLANSTMLAAVRDNLLAAQQGGEFSQEEELERVMQIRYLSSAAAWEGNPLRKQAIASMSEVVLAEFPTGLSREVRGSLLGDKMELYQYLILNDPVLADELMTRVKGTRLEPVLLVARRMIEPPSSDMLPNQQL